MYINLPIRVPRSLTHLKLKDKKFKLTKLTIYDLRLSSFSIILIFNLIIDMIGLALALVSCGLDAKMVVPAIGAFLERASHILPMLAGKQLAPHSERKRRSACKEKD
jgi:hypothetical protein